MGKDVFAQLSPVPLSKVSAPTQRAESDQYKGKAFIFINSGARIKVEALAKLEAESELH